MKSNFNVVTFILMVVLASCSSDYSEEILDLPDTVQNDDDQNNDEEPTDPMTDVGDISEEDLAILNTTLDLPDSFFIYDGGLPNFFLNNNLNGEDNTPANNPVSNPGATLGRVLFYDVRLSANNTISCASCHLQENGFSDPDQFSTGFEGGLTGRNSMGLANARFYDNGRFFWDERAASLEAQVLLPIQDAVEMGLSLEELESKLANEAYYQVLFRLAFGDETVTSNRISLALAQFVRSMVSYQSKFDEGLAQSNNPNQNFPNFTASENRGKQLFNSNMTNCSECHHTNAQVGDAARNNGLDATFTDLGVGGVTNNNNQNGEFKVPSLRNIALTAPYMHDGRFATLREVIEHYNTGVQNSATLDNRLRVQGGNVRRLNLSEDDIQALEDFLLTLTDELFIQDEKFSNPFRNEFLE
ncbi:cytochrome-c peroxidase [Flagellimonas flava]|uniref:Cytochrome c peroxidase n=1 Tax=Flagellimonas flava TaxID=570519 RepID=A0A1M5I3R3_9FLAO|nr:cytochrome c peroxidase [Allomuricauda flava]SHG22955.1 cytochrome c peroxidase [Allomuricauda flava]